MDITLPLTGKIISLNVDMRKNFVSNAISDALRLHFKTGICGSIYVNGGLYRENRSEI